MRPVNVTQITARFCQFRCRTRQVTQRGRALELLHPCHQGSSEPELLPGAVKVPTSMRSRIFAHGASRRRHNIKRGSDGTSKSVGLTGMAQPSDKPLRFFSYLSRRIHSVDSE